MLSPADLQRARRGAEFKRVVRSGAAMRDMFEDVDIAGAVGVSRNAVQGWWRGAAPSVPTLRRIAQATGVPYDDLESIAYPDEPDVSGPPQPPDDAEIPPMPPELERAAREAASSSSRRPTPDRRRP